MTAPPSLKPPPLPDAMAFRERMLAQARDLRATAEAAFLPAVRSQLMTRVAEYENAACDMPMSRDGATLRPNE
jgi:hypothetical protein